MGEQDLNTSLEPILALLETERRSALKGAMTAAYISFGISLFFAVVFLLGDSGLGYLPLLAPFVVAVVAYIIAYSIGTSDYRNGFKSRVMPHLVRYCAQEANGSLLYLSSEGISENEFRKSGLFRYPDRYSSEDYVHGTVGETALHFSEVHAEYRQVTSNGKTTTVTYHTIFKGLFLIADFNKEFHGTTYVKPDFAQNLFGRFGQNLQELGANLSLSGREFVRLEDPEFEQTFVVYSTDQVEARYILSPALMERLLRFREYSNSELHIAFTGGHMIIAMPHSEPWLEPPALGTPLTTDTLAKCLRQLHFAIGIVAALDLNTRIWSK